jgi:hypothetical protein
MLRRLVCAAVLATVAVVAMLFASAAGAHPAPAPAAVASMAGMDMSSTSESMPGMDMPGTSGTTPIGSHADYAGRYAIVGGFAASWFAVCIAALMLRRRGRAELDRRAAARAAAQTS